MRGAQLTHARLLEVAHYDPETGIFTARINRGQIKVGQSLGVLDSRGYLVFVIDGRRYSLHRLAWLYVHGRWPKEAIDHRDVDKLNNRIANLREATGTHNQANRPLQRNNKSGFKGVFWDKQNKRWRSQIRFKGKDQYLGNYKTPKEAHAAYVRAALRLFGEFARAA